MDKFELSAEEIEALEREQKAIEKAPKVMFYPVFSDSAGWKVTCERFNEDAIGFKSFHEAEAFCCLQEGNEAGAEQAYRMASTLQRPLYEINKVDAEGRIEMVWRGSHQ